MHGTQVFLPGFGVINLLQTAKNDTVLPGAGFINDFNNYQSSNATPFLIGYPA